jgi:hypothetical protein
VKMKIIIVIITIIVTLDVNVSHDNIASTENREVKLSIMQ